MNTNKKIPIMLIIISMAVSLFAIAFVIYSRIERNLDYEYATKVQSLIDKAYNSNIYIQAKVSEDDFIAFLYNKNKEAFSQSKSGGIAVYRKDNKMVSFDEELVITYSISPLKMIELALELVAENKADIKKIDDNLGVMGSLTIYEINILGDKNVRSLYSKIDPHYAEDMMTLLYQYASKSNRKMRLGIVEGTNNEFGAYCHIIINNEILTVWKFDGYLEMFDWQLDGRWYNDDTTDTDVWVELANALVYEIEQKSKNMDLIPDEDTSNENVHIHEDGEIHFEPH